MRQFHDQLQSLLQKVVMMGSLAEGMILTAIDSLTRGDMRQMEDVFDREQQLNRLQVEVDDQAVTLTALQQPVAQDARYLFMASRIGGELERIGDQSVNVCQNSVHVHKSTAGGGPVSAAAFVDIRVMAELARAMVRDSLTAMMKRDVALANKVLEQDEQLDALRDQNFQSLLSAMSENPASIQRSMSLILIARNLERIGDHATNIGEEVIYWINGRDVRHGRGLGGSSVSAVKS